MPRGGDGLAFVIHDNGFPGALGAGLVPRHPLHRAPSSVNSHEFLNGHTRCETRASIHV